MQHFIAKYRQVFLATWANGFVYRLNFVMWRVRNVVQLLTVFFLWYAVFSNTDNAFDYTQAEMFTYIIGTAVLRSFVFSSRSTDVQSEISSGDLNNQLIKPFNYFTYWLTRDLADKLLNILFTAVELTLIIVLFDPNLLGPASLQYLTAFIIAIPLAMLMYFFFSLIISCSTFWMPEGNGWPQRFLIFVILEFFSGGLFPLDILPEPLFQIAVRLPTAYFMYVPLQIYLGKIPPNMVIQALFIMMFWILALWFFAKKMFNRGVKVYGAYGG